jgi:fido (protein-threonine AMPylation protein)
LKDVTRDEYARMVQELITVKGNAIGEGGNATAASANEEAKFNTQILREIHRVLYNAVSSMNHDGWSSQKMLL